MAQYNNSPKSRRLDEPVETKRLRHDCRDRPLSLCPSGGYRVLKSNALLFVTCSFNAYYRSSQTDFATKRIVRRRKRNLRAAQRYLITILLVNYIFWWEMFKPISIVYNYRVLVTTKMCLASAVPSEFLAWQTSARFVNVCDSIKMESTEFSRSVWAARTTGSGPLSSWSNGSHV